MLFRPEVHFCAVVADRYDGDDFKHDVDGNVVPLYEAGRPDCPVHGYVSYVDLLSPSFPLDDGQKIPKTVHRHLRSAMGVDYTSKHHRPRRESHAPDARPDLEIQRPPAEPLRPAPQPDAAELPARRLKQEQAFVNTGRA